MSRWVAVIVILAAACGGGSELRELAAETCSVLVDPDTSPAARSLVVFESTTEAIDRGYTEEDFMTALGAECGDSVIIGGQP